MNKNLGLRHLFLIFSFLVSSQPSFASSEPAEIRVGVIKHDVKSGLKHTYEPGYDVNLQYLWASFGGENERMILSPRPHLGCSVNTRGGTNQYYAGLTWHVPIKNLFVEVSLGGEFHDGHLKNRSSKKKALGSRLLFRESIAFGVNLSEQATISAILDHASNASIAPPNPGLTGFGIQFGYKF